MRNEEEESSEDDARRSLCIVSSLKFTSFRRSDSAPPEAPEEDCRGRIGQRRDRNGFAGRYASNSLI